MSRSMSKPDPIFALIEAHRKAEDTHATAVARLEKLEIALTKKNPAARRKWGDVTNDTPTFYIGGDIEAVLTDPRRIKLTPDEQIENHVTKYLANRTQPFGPKTKAKIEAMHGAAVRELCAMHKAFMDDHSKRRHDSGLTAAVRALGAAEDSASRAMRKLCSTVPTTPHGRKAMLEYLEPLIGGELEGMFADGRTGALWRTLINAVGQQR